MSINRFLSSFAATALLAAGACALPSSAYAQQRFNSPQDAAKALIEAARTNDQAAYAQIFGKDHADLFADDGDPAVAARTKTAAAAAERLLVYRKDSNDQVTLVIGAEAYPYPIPLVRKGGKWEFDANAGAEEVINRRVGQNELATISVLEDLVNAEVEYAKESRDGSGVRQFATLFRSSEGKHDGLYWPTPDGSNEPRSPLGPLLDEKGTPPAGSPYYGYRYRILTGQGEHAPGGAYSYVINGRLVAGFAFLAYPAEYGATGVMTFLVNHYGDVYQCDLGDDTEAKAAALSVYDLGDNWTAVPK
jgi:hypothetical protein